MGRLITVFALLLATTARAQPDVDWNTAKEVNVLMVDDQFVPDHLTFQHGVPYRLLLENDGTHLHEFTAPEFLADAVIRDPSVLTQNGKEVVVQPGVAIYVDLVPIHPGTFKLICADHDWDGMVGEIVVD
jgi:uncharacterized cupredoxin-like copper-binding protein